MIPELSGFERFSELSQMVKEEPELFASIRLKGRGRTLTVITLEMNEIIKLHNFRVNGNVKSIGHSVTQNNHSNTKMTALDKDSFYRMWILLTEVVRCSWLIVTWILRICRFIKHSVDWFADRRDDGFFWKMGLHCCSVPVKFIRFAKDLIQSVIGWATAQMRYLVDRACIVIQLCVVMMVVLAGIYLIVFRM